MGEDPLRGRVVGERWEVIEPLARGGMSTVYEGLDRLDGTRVAIKVLRTGLKPELRSAERFLREAKAASRVDHPNVISIVAHGELESGQLYLVMELVEGVALSRAIRAEAPFGPRRATRVALQVAAALKQAHDLGVFHRDLKPANIILLHRRTDPDFVKILDFGLAKLSSPDEGDSLTKAGLIFGTPEYMSPEQAVGKAVDGRCDLYALGAILYEMLVGRPPFKGEGIFETVRMHVAEPPPAPRDVRPDLSIPPMLEGVVLRCLEKEAADRFESAAHLERVLSAVAAQLDRTASPQETAEESAADSREATKGGDRVALIDPGEAAEAELQQLQRHRHETIRLAAAQLDTHPLAPQAEEHLTRIDRLEQLALDRGAELALADSAADEERSAIQERVSSLRLAYIDLQMESTAAREAAAADPLDQGATERFAAVSAELDLLAEQVSRAERELALKREEARSRKSALRAKVADAEDALEQLYDELAAMIREAAASRRTGDLPALVDDLDAFDRWLSAHDQRPSPPAGDGGENGRG